jgi:hypothetical protein
LYDTGSSTGFARNSDGYDPLSAGTPRDSWGLSVNGAPGVYADQFLYGNNGVTSSSTYTANSATVTSSTKVDYAVVQDYSFLAPNVMEISGMVTNDSGAAGSVVFQRDIAWEVPPTLFDGTSSGQCHQPGDQCGGQFLLWIGACGYFSGVQLILRQRMLNTGDDGGGIKISLGTIGVGATAARIRRSSRWRIRPECRSRAREGWEPARCFCWAWRQARESSTGSACQLVLRPGNSWTMFMRLVHATSVAFFREKTNATEVACTGNAAQLLAGNGRETPERSSARRYCCCCSC